MQTVTSLRKFPGRQSLKYITPFLEYIFYYTFIYCHISVISFTFYTFGLKFRIYYLILSKNTRYKLHYTIRPPVKHAHECHLPAILGTNGNQASPCGHLANQCKGRSSGILWLNIRNTCKRVNHAHLRPSQQNVNYEYQRLRIFCIVKFTDVTRVRK